MQKSGNSQESAASLTDRVGILSPMTFPRLPRYLLITGVLGLTALGGAGAATVVQAAAGSNLPVLNIRQVAATDAATSTKPAAGAAKTDRTKRCHHAPLDDATAAKVKSAALAAVPGATVDHVGHDRSDGYFAALTKADGTTRVLVHEDKDFKVTNTEDPAPARGPGGHKDHRGHHPDKSGATSGEGTGTQS